MLTYLELRNFQCHEFLKVKLDSSITTIIGPSDSGKSAVLRALRWVAFNRPLGDGVIRRGADWAMVRLKVDDKWVVRFRSKGGRENYYELDGERLEAMGGGVPDGVKALLRLGEENFQGQHDGPFWLSLSGGEVARRLNRIADLDAMDEITKELRGAIREVQVGVRLLQDRVNGCRSGLRRLGWVPLAMEDYRVLDGLDGRYWDLSNRADSLVGLLAEWNRESIRSRKLADVCRGWEVLEELGDRVQRLQERHQKLFRLISEWQGWFSVLDRDFGVAERLGSVLFEWGVLNERGRELRRLLGAWEAWGRRVNDLSGKMESVVEELRMVSGGRCPLCGQAWDVSELVYE